MSMMSVCYQVHKMKQECPVCGEYLKSVAYYDSCHWPISADKYPDLNEVSFGWHWENIGWDCRH